VTLDDSIRIALLVVLQQLSPAERAVFVLHDVFQFSFDAVAEIVGRSAAACRQLASRARRRIESETEPGRFAADAVDQRLVTQRFIAACAGGDLSALLALLDVDAVGDVDLGAGVPPRRPTRGHRAIARGLLVFYGPATSTTLVSQPVNGHPGVLAFHDHRLVGILQLKARDGLVYDIHAIADPVKLAFVQHQLVP
jgi:RNA polymerase sigma-70 factor (ECF subfamily)